jgi:hypothetical protein
LLVCPGQALSVKRLEMRAMYASLNQLAVAAHQALVAAQKPDEAPQASSQAQPPQASSRAQPPQASSRAPTYPVDSPWAPCLAAQSVAEAQIRISALSAQRVLERQAQQARAAEQTLVVAQSDLRRTSSALSSTQMEALNLVAESSAVQACSPEHPFVP